MRRLKEYSDRELVELLKSNNASAFDELYLRYVPRLDAFLSVYTKDDYLREEIIQDVFVKIWQKREQLDPSLSFKAFLFQAVKYQLFNVFRKKATHLTLKNTVAERYCTNDTEEYLNFVELQNNLSSIINNLPDMQRQVFTMSRVEGFNNDEIAHKLNLSKRTVEHHIYLALKYIKQKLPAFEIGLSLALFHLIC